MKKPVQCLNVFDLTNIILPVAVCMFVSVSAAVAQTTAVPPANGQVPLPHVQFNVSSIPQPKAGRGYAYSLCTGQVIPDADIWGKIGVHAHVTPAKGLKYDTAHPCGPVSDSVNPMVSGGNPPYHFQLDTGGFPPIGVHLGLNGTLYGQPVGMPPLGGYQPFSVCAVDLNGNQDCQKVTYSEPPQTQAKAKVGHHGPSPLVLGAVGLGLAAVGAAAAASSSSSSGGTLNGHCAGGSSSNACGACTCAANACNPSSQCGGGDCWTSSPIPPFCS
ncbi:MAG: hypothetical protein ACYCO5_07340 [Acidobacteriaceae bacterium]